VPADAKVFYTPTHVIIRSGQPYWLDLNADAMNDFEFRVFTCSSICYGKGFVVNGKSSGYSRQNGVALASTSGEYAFAAALRKGSRIPGARSFGTNAVLASSNGGFHKGRWFNIKDRYLGLAFYINGYKHYGWARMSILVKRHPFTITGVLTGYAFESIRSKPIIAGKTKGPDVITVQPASLGHLAHGAAAIPAWRARHSAH
jgi:hypothetical protein